MRHLHNHPLHPPQNRNHRNSHHYKMKIYLLNLKRIIRDQGVNLPLLQRENHSLRQSGKNKIDKISEDSNAMNVNYSIKLWEKMRLLKHCARMYQDTGHNSLRHKLPRDSGILELKGFNSTEQMLVHNQKHHNVQWTIQKTNVRCSTDQCVQT